MIKKPYKNRIKGLKKKKIEIEIFSIEREMKEKN